MKKLFLVAAMMLMASASAHAGSYSFHVDGQKVRISVPRGCASIHCINVNAPDMSGKFGSKDKDDAPTTTATAPTPAPAAAPAPAPASASVQQITVPAPVQQIAAPAAAPVAPTPVTTQASSKVVMLAPPDATSSSSSTVSAPSLTAPEASLQPAPAPAPVPTQVVTAAPAPAATQASDSPIGVWLSEKKEGKIRIEDCGGNLCGYSVDAKTGANGAQVLINMKPKGDKWAGRIRDTRSGSNYDSTITLRGSNQLKVQGCAFGGMFCGGETWTRTE